MVARIHQASNPLTPPPSFEIPSRRLGGERLDRPNNLYNTRFHISLQVDFDRDDRDSMFPRSISRHASPGEGEPALLEVFKQWLDMRSNFMKG